MTVMPWLDFVSRYLLEGDLLAAEEAAPGQSAQAEPDPAPALRVHVDRLYANSLWLAGRRFEGVELSLQMDEENWQVQVDTDWLRGTAALPPVVWATAWLCWHMVSVALLLIPAGFFLSINGDPSFGWAAVALMGSFGAVSLITPPFLGVSFKLLPQVALLFPVALIGAVGLLM